MICNVQAPVREQPSTAYRAYSAGQQPSMSTEVSLQHSKDSATTTYPDPQASRSHAHPTSVLPGRSTSFRRLIAEIIRADKLTKPLVTEHTAAGCQGRVDVGSTPHDSHTQQAYLSI